MNRRAGPSSVKAILRNHGLSIALFGWFLVFEAGLSVVGQRHYNQELANHHLPPLSYAEYLISGSFLEATMENWESEFLQLFAYVVFTTVLYQRGSAESKRLSEDEAVDRNPGLGKNRPDAPWPVRRGGMALVLYSHSLGIALFLLFVSSFFLHAYSGARAHSIEELAHGRAAVSVIEYLASAQFWFESLQNWQSEFFSIGAMVVLSIALREKGSPESKPVDAPHAMTGHE